MGYEVSVDGNTEEVPTKKEADATLKEVLADGEEHTVAVAKVEADKEEEAAAEPKKAAAKKSTSKDAPPPADLGGGIPVVL